MPVIVSASRLSDIATIEVATYMKLQLEKVSKSWNASWPGGVSSFIDEKILPLGEELLDRVPPDMRPELHDMLINITYAITDKQKKPLWCLFLVSLHRSLPRLDYSRYPRPVHPLLDDCIKNFNKLESLTITNNLSEKTWCDLLYANAYTLRHLNLLYGFNNFLARSLSRLADLRVLEWRQSKLSYEGICDISRLKCLREIRFDNSELTDTYLSDLIRLMPELRVISPEVNMTRAFVELRNVGWKERRKLEQLNVGLVKDRRVFSLLSYTFEYSLKKLILCYDWYGKLNLDQFPNCTILEFRHLSKHVEECLSRATNITSLSLMAGGQHDLTAINELMPNLKSLVMDNTNTVCRKPKSAHFKNLEHVTMKGPYPYNDVCKYLFSHCSGIHSVRLESVSVSQTLEEMLKVNKFEELRELQLCGYLSQEQAEKHLTQGFLTLPKLEKLTFLVVGLDDNTFLRNVKNTRMDIIKMSMSSITAFPW